MIGLDFETFSEVDLPKYGADNYFSHPSTRPLISATARRLDDGSMHSQLIDPITTGTPLSALRATIQNAELVAHSAAFERAVLKLMDMDKLPIDIIDSAVIARGYGAGSKLEAAGPQLVNVDKMDAGVRLIKKFSMPQKDGYVYVDHVDEWTAEDWEDWRTFGEYCIRDAEISLLIAEGYENILPPHEWTYEKITQAMNERGWTVDVALVQKMRSQYKRNLLIIESNFSNKYPSDPPLNFRSTPQLSAWCKERGVLAKSFDELHVAKLLNKLEARILRLDHNDPKRSKYLEVQDLLVTKQMLGGSSLSKLDTILNLVGPDQQLRGQYVHVGAGQSFRTSGRGVQMQNLKRLGSDLMPLTGNLSTWSNEQLAENIRRVFTASHPKGKLLVGDLSSIESRALAFLAGDTKKLEHFREERDLYKVLAASMFHTSYERVTAGQRQIGKVGELSCGYGAGSGAVASFAEKMGLKISDSEAGDIVHGWRDTNDVIVRFWKELDDALHRVMGSSPSETIRTPVDQEMAIDLQKILTPDSLREQMPQAQSIELVVFHRGRRVMSRYFQGCFMVGNDICYHKPSELKSGKLWLDRWTKDGQSGRYKLYGGKLAGILTQSFCRELFFSMLERLEHELSQTNNAKIIGQFHDEIVVDWAPRSASVSWSGAKVVQTMQSVMTTSPYPDLPLNAVIKGDYRYIK